MNNNTGKECIVVHICLENTWKIKQINVYGFPVIDSKWRHLESDAGFKTLLLHPKINKNTPHSEMATLSSGSKEDEVLPSQYGKRVTLRDSPQLSPPYFLN